MTKLYAAVYSKMLPQYMFIIVIPLVIIFSCTAIILSLPNINDLLLYGLIIASLALSVVLVKWCINTKASVPAKIAVAVDGISITLQHRSLFYHHLQQEIKWHSIKNMSNNFDPQQDFQYVLIEPKHGGTIQLISDKNAPNDFDILWKLLEEARNYYNENKLAYNAETITGISFYHTSFAKILTWAVVIGGVVLAILLLTKMIDLPMYKIIGYYTISLYWLAKVKQAKSQQ